MKQTYLRAAAESYARVSELQTTCYHFIDSQSELLNDRLTGHYRQLLAQRIKPKYINAIVCTALTELSYPTYDTDKYAWSGNQRAAFAGIDKAVWSRNELTKQVNFVIDNVRSNASAVKAAIDEQLEG